MHIISPVLPGLHLPTLRRAGPSNQKKMLLQRERVRRLDHNSAQRLYRPYLRAERLTPEACGIHSRRRIFSKSNVFFAFLYQVQCEGGGSLMDAVRHIQNTAAGKGAVIPASRTNAYSKARSRFPIETLYTIDEDLAELTLPCNHGLLGGRRLIGVDGTGMSMPDTPANQRRWPQPGGQAVGCGFPNLFFVGLFNLADGMILSHAVGSKYDGERSLYRMLHPAIRPGDVVLGDKLYSSWLEMQEARALGADMISSFNKTRKPFGPNDKGVKKLGEGDLLVPWTKPSTRPKGVSAEEWSDMPPSIPMREIIIHCDVPGYRAKKIRIATTLLDPVTYPREEIAAAYLRRWEVEMMFDVMKTTLSMDVLRCKSPAMIEKEIYMHLISYNLLRLVIRDAMGPEQRRRDISFKAALQYIRQWLARQVAKPTFEARRETRELREAIRNATVPLRPGRREPRVRKRRPKNYHLMTRPRAVMQETKHRNRYRAPSLK